MRLFLVRHAHALPRGHGGRDIERPLSAEGFERSRQLATMLEPAGISKILSSPATRCRQTVEPLAEALGLAVDEHPDLWEGSAVAHVLALIGQQEASSVAVCTHGDIIPALIETLMADGVPMTGRGNQKGSVWILDYDGQAWIAGRYLDRSHDRLPEPI